jgi:hypothetical protein
MPQAYAVDTGQAWQKAANVQPDTISALAWRTWSPITDNLVAIVAAYGRVQSGWQIGSALEAQLMRAEYEGFPEVSVWVEEALVGQGTTAKTRRQVLSEVEITGSSAVVTTGLSARMLIGTGMVAAGAGAAIATRRRWVPWFAKAIRALRGGG